jgi:hypothetical protein
LAYAIHHQPVFGKVADYHDVNIVHCVPPSTRRGSNPKSEALNPKQYLNPNDQKW